LTVDQDQHKLGIYGLAGKALVTVNSGVVDQARLAGPDLVVRNAARLRVYDAASGKLRATWKLASRSASPFLGDVDSGIAVYQVGSALHLLRLDNGRDRVFRQVKGLIAARLEPGGLFYAYNVQTGGAKPGRVTFVPFARLT